MDDVTTGANPPDWEVRPYQPGDEEQLVALYARVFGRPRSVAFWRWKLKGRNPPFERAHGMNREPLSSTRACAIPTIHPRRKRVRSRASRSALFASCQRRRSRLCD